MDVNKVRGYLKKWGRENDILEFDTSIATVELAAQALGVEPARIAKTISFKNNEDAMLIVAAGDAKMDNRKFKSEFGFKAKMLTPEENLEYIGYAVGGVCPFGVKSSIPIFLDISLKDLRLFSRLAEAAIQQLSLRVRNLKYILQVKNG